VKVGYGYQTALDGLKRGILTAEDRMAKAATKAMREAAKELQSRARTEFAGRGLTRRWQTAFFARAKPRLGYSLKASMRGYDRIPWINVLERGGTATGKPLIWIPLPTAPQKIGRKRITPRLYVQQIGPLHSINVPGHPPILAGEALRAGARSVASLKSGARNASARRGGGKGRKTVSVPMFIGLKSAQLRKRVNIDHLYKDIAADLPRLYAQQMLGLGA
jgi:hypothetical protein